MGQSGKSYIDTGGSKTPCKSKFKLDQRVGIKFFGNNIEKVLKWEKPEVFGVII